MASRLTPLVSLLAALLLLLCSAMWAGNPVFGGVVKMAAQAGKVLPAHAIFAPETDPTYVAEIEAMFHASTRHNYEEHWRVMATASMTGGSADGDSLVLTWSIVPDGTLIPGGAMGVGEAPCTSNLVATMNARYGEGTWLAEISEVFEAWAQHTGNIYVYEPQDDGAAWPLSKGIPGARGDIRISGCRIDGDSGILAYNFYPSLGDMKIDATDSFFSGQGNNRDVDFHNVVSHEHGHGVGLAHVCPANGTKLMEPYVNRSFISLQHDDIRGAQRGYGDVLERPGAPNDSAPTRLRRGS